MAQRRSRPEYTPADVFNLVCYGPVLWPGRTIRLERDSLLDQCSRQTSAQLSIAELYHENSKLSPLRLPELALTTVDSAALRAEFLRRRGAVAQSDGDEPEPVRPWKELLGRACAADPDWLYAIEPRLVVDGSMFAYEPVSGTLRLLKRLTAAQAERFARALALTGASPAAGAAVVLLVGCFARNEILFGDRGYRRTLIEAGHLAGELARRARDEGRRALVRYEFTDREIDSLTEVDGVEQGVIVAVELG